MGDFFADTNYWIALMHAIREWIAVLPGFLVSWLRR